MQILKRNKGITLVVLIITIIILLILAGVSISFLIGDNGVINKSQSAVNEYEEASKKEQDLLEQIDKYLENELGGGSAGDDTQTVPSVDENGLATKNTTIVAKDDPNVQIVIPKGFAPAILQTGTTQSLPGEDGSVKEIMPAKDWNDITKDDINKGIVVVDNEITYDGGQASGNVSDFNEYVWIPITDSSKFDRSDWNRGDILVEVSTENAYWEDKTTQVYKDMVDSININKGFYISRYEASQKDNTTAQSKRGQDPWVNVSQLDAITASGNTKTNSHLIYGIEWDSVLNWLNGNAIISSSTKGETKITELVDIQTDSRSWGNYINSTGDAAINSGDVQQTGTSEYWKVNNIYDIAGNVWEWTQEKYSTGDFCAGRGGHSNGYGDYFPASGRVHYNGNDEVSTGSRVQSRILCVMLFMR